jgi:hypothetical protein
MDAAFSDLNRIFTLYIGCRDLPTNALSCMLLYLHDGSCMFRQNNAVLREQQRSFLSYFNVSMVRGKSWNVSFRPGHEISGLNPVARSESLAAIFSRTDLIKEKNGQMPIAKLKYFVANGDLATGNFAPWFRRMCQRVVRRTRSLHIR